MNMTTKRIICALVLSALLSGWTINGQAQMGERNARPKSLGAERCPPVEQSLLGAWLASFTPIYGQASQPLQQFYYVQPFQTHISFNDDGVLVDAPPSLDIEQRCEAIECAAPAILRITPSVGVGTWAGTVEGIYTLSYIHLLHDSEGRNMGEL
jgi:hypothetical protein